MVLLSFALAAILGAGIGAALVWAAFRMRPARQHLVPPAPHPPLPVRDVPFSSSIDEVATALDFAFAAGSELRLLGIYAGRDDGDALDARWRAPHVDPRYLPRTAPAVLFAQLGQARLVDAEELATGLHPALGPASADAEASAGHELAPPPMPKGISENPFEIDDDALMHAKRTETKRRSPLLDDEALAARIVAAPWTGPFGWRGVVAAQPMGADRARDLGRLDEVMAEVGLRLGIHCAVSTRPAEPAVVAPPPVVEPVAPPPPAPAVASVENPVAHARLQRATARMADALMSPRRVRDVIRATVTLLADGLATDRCFAVEVEGLHPLPVEHERRSEAAASAIGIDFGDTFLQAVRSRVGQTITAISLDANSGQLVVPEHAAIRLGPVSRMIVPVLEKGRIVVVYVAEWIDLAKKLTHDDVGFAEQAVARSATARERVLQFDALAEQAAHAREDQEQMGEALEQLQALVAASPEALIGLDRDGNVAFANPAAARLLGHMEFELMGRPLRSVAGPVKGHDGGVWERVLASDALQCFYGSYDADGNSIDVTVVPGLVSGAFSRIVSMREVRAADRIRSDA